MSLTLLCILAYSKISWTLRLWSLILPQEIIEHCQSLEVHPDLRLGCSPWSVWTLLQFHWAVLRRYQRYHDIFGMKGRKHGLVFFGNVDMWDMHREKAEHFFHYFSLVHSLFLHWLEEGILQQLHPLPEMDGTVTRRETRRRETARPVAPRTDIHVDVGRSVVAPRRKGSVGPGPADYKAAARAREAAGDGRIRVRSSELEILFIKKWRKVTKCCVTPIIHFLNHRCYDISVTISPCYDPKVYFDSKVLNLHVDVRIAPEWCFIQAKT